MCCPLQHYCCGCCDGHTIGPEWCYAPRKRFEPPRLGSTNIVVQWSEAYMNGMDENI